LAEQVIDLRAFPGQVAEMLCPACLTPGQHHVDLAHISWMEISWDLDQPSVVQPGDALTVSPVAEIVNDRGFVVWPDGRDFECGCSPVGVMQDRVYRTLSSVAVIWLDRHGQNTPDDGESEPLFRTFLAHRAPQF
jgi:hypothetical protein